MAKVEIIKRSKGDANSILKKTAWTGIAESLALIIIGVLLIACADVIVKVLAYIIGVFFVVKGGCQIVNYFMVKGQNDFLNSELLIGIISALIGVVALVMGPELLGVFRIVIGIWIIYESLARISLAIKLNAAGIIVWKYIVAFSILMLVLGIFVTFNNGAVFQLIGWLMVIAGVVSIISDIMFTQYITQVAEKINETVNKS